MMARANALTLKTTPLRHANRGRRINLKRYLKLTAGSARLKFNGLGEIAGVFRGRELTRKEGRLRCGITPIDDLIGGGIVRGRISEIIGDASAGKTSLAAAFAAAATGRGEVVAWIDADGGLDPASTAAAGVDLARLLWVAMPVSRSGAGYRTAAGDIECQRGEIERGRPYPHGSLKRWRGRCCRRVAVARAMRGRRG